MGGCEAARATAAVSSTLLTHEPVLPKLHALAERFCSDLETLLQDGDGALSTREVRELLSEPFHTGPR